jgi:hypothetical protein
VTALTLPGLDVAAWQIRSNSDPAARALADQHYSRGTPGSPWVGPPGRKLMLVTPCERAVWQTHWPDGDLTLDGLDAWRCSIFRRSPGAPLASELIEAAMVATLAYWQRAQTRPRHSWKESLPADGWVTWIDRRYVASANPGYCYKQAGWRLDRDWSSPYTPSLVRLRAEIES